MNRLTKLFSRKKNKTKNKKKTQFGQNTFSDDESDENHGYNFRGECTVVTGYKAKHPDELTIEISQVVSNVKSVSDGWLRGELNGNVGRFPEHCVKGRKDELQHGKNTTQEDIVHTEQNITQGDFRIKDDDQARGIETFIVETSNIVNNFEVIKDGLLPGDVQQKISPMPGECIKVGKEEAPSEKYWSNEQKLKLNKEQEYRGEAIDHLHFQASIADESTVKSGQVIDNVEMNPNRQSNINQMHQDYVCSNCYNSGSGCLSSDGQEKGISFEKTQENINETSVDGKCIYNRKPTSDGNEHIFSKDLLSKVQITTPVIKSDPKLTREDKETYWKKSLDADENLPEIKQFINKLGLDEYYPDKLQVRDVMKIKHSVKPVNFKDIALMFVRHIIMINLNGRDRFVQDTLRQIHQDESGKENSNDNYLNKILKRKNRGSFSDINPLDLTIAVFKCGSPMLKHTLGSKCFTSQLAVPFVFPKYCNEDISISLTTLHSIVIECTSKEISINEVCLNCPCHVVSFVRFGSLSLSKSKLVNEILNDQYHNTFFNRDCPLGSSKRCISDGLIEAAWYLPSRKSNVLSSVTTFLNLRGDANRFQEQLIILSNISSLLVILVDVNSLNEQLAPSNLKSLLDNVHGIILAIDANRNTEDELYKMFKAYLEKIEKYSDRVTFCILKINEKMLSLADIKKEMRDSISTVIEKAPLTSIASRIKSCKIKTDEDNGCYQHVQQTVLDLWKLFPESCQNAKQLVIPVQGKHWEKWSRKLKEFNKSSLYKSPQEAGKIKKEMIDERMKQVELCQEIHPFMKNFITCFWECSETENESHVFVILLKSLLDERSRRILPTFQIQYLSDWQELTLAKEQKKEQSVIDELLTKVENSERHLFEASFGFEHLCRELGQIFEALSECETEHKELQEFETILPKLAVRLLLMGHPFELMDGDVANVPQIWMKAVFRELKQSLGDTKKLLALSVLGIQSSGKSTLLNTMFGLKFAVSAGRCTRGVYVQLMPVESDAFPFDYILVVDTEGLRALELADLKYSHDNELATFVVGLGDITIVNIKGENTTEVQDVLQIVVHAFLRLKLANKKSSLKQRCIFAHQNVPAQDAIEKMRHGRQKFIEILDKMTKEAAAQEQISDIQTFNEVIQLDIEKDVWYFSDLWRGDPPMAPANPGYSETVASALEAITNRLIVERETYLTITDTVTRIEDLWKGILKDDFVFNFRNCLEVKAFNNMERQFHSLTWEIEQKVREFVKAEAKISLMTCHRAEDFNTQIPKISLQLSNIVNKDLQVGTKKLDLFIENNCLKEIMIQWQKSKHNKFNVFGEELITQAQIDIFNMKEEMKIEKIRMTDSREHEFEINRRAQQLAVSMKGTFPKEHVVEQAFNNMWNGWISQFDTKAIQHGHSIKEQIELSIHNRFPTDVTYLITIDQSWLVSHTPYQTMTKLENVYSKLSISREHFTIHTAYLIKKKMKDDECKNQVIEVVNVIFRKIDSILSKLLVQDIKFNISYVKEILEIINDAFEEHNEHKNKCYQFNLTNVFRAFVCTHVKHYLVIFFERLDKKYDAKHSPKAVMEEYKGTVWKLFTNTVQSKTEDVIAVGFFREALIKEIDKNISGLMPIDVQSYILSKFPFRKLRLIKDILTKITAGDFSEMKSYIQDPLGYSTKWITDITNKYLFEDRENGSTKYASLATSRIEHLFVQIARAITDASEVCEKTDCKTISKWIDYFVRNVNDNKFPISNDTMVHVKSRSDTSLESFIEMLNQELKDIKIEIVTLFENRTKENVLWDENPIPKIMLKLWGCPENCMFCKEPCINTDKDHVELGYDHECLQHRPQGIGGFNWSNTAKLCVEFCNNWVGSEQSYRWNVGKDNEERRKYKDYKKHFPDWDIPHSHDKSQYWMWTMCKFKDELAQMYSKEPPDIPENWPLITKVQALESLSVYMAD